MRPVVFLFSLCSSTFLLRGDNSRSYNISHFIFPKQKTLNFWLPELLRVLAPRRWRFHDSSAPHLAVVGPERYSKPHRSPGPAASQVRLWEVSGKMCGFSREAVECKDGMWSVRMGCGLIREWNVFRAVGFHHHTRSVRPLETQTLLEEETHGLAAGSRARRGGFNTNRIHTHRRHYESKAMVSNSELYACVCVCDGGYNRYVTESSSTVFFYFL